jgi:hypothetical protein
MSTAYTGGCACGGIRYAIDDAPVMQHHCQCRDCQRRSGTGHSSYLTFPDRTKVALTGTATDWRLAGDSGSEKIHSFCPVCGTPVHLTFAAAPQAFAVHAGSLDEPLRFEPSLVTYAGRGLSWDPLDAALTKFEGMPD